MEIHELDSDGDVIIKLHDPNQIFAAWDETQDYASILPLSFESDFPRHSEIWFPSLETEPEPEPELEPEDDPVEAEPRPAPEDDLPPEDAPALEFDKDESAYDEPAEPTGEPSVEMRVSSKHLMLASPQIKRMLKGDWKEASALRSQGHLCMEEAEWGAEALLILMNIIHGRTKSVPRHIALEMLAKMAVLVDYYECLEVVEVFSDMWIAHLKEELPKTYSRDVVLWICISSVFRQPEEFRAATSLALKYSRGPVQTMNLPISENIIRKSFLII
jgi:hypothetical protein